MCPPSPPPLPSLSTCSALPCYVHLLDLFHEVTYQTAHGQLLDTTTAPIGTVSQPARQAGVQDRAGQTLPVLQDLPLSCRPLPATRRGLFQPAPLPCHNNMCLQVDLSRYTLAPYLRIVTYKTAYYTFYLPVACGLRLAGLT